MLSLAPQPAVPVFRGGIAQGCSRRTKGRANRSAVPKIGCGSVRRRGRRQPRTPRRRACCAALATGWFASCAAVACRPLPCPREPIPNPFDLAPHPVIRAFRSGTARCTSRRTLKRLRRHPVSRVVCSTHGRPGRRRLRSPRCRARRHSSRRPPEFRQASRKANPGTMTFPGCRRSIMRAGRGMSSEWTNCSAGRT